MVGCFDRIEEKRDATEVAGLPPARRALAQAALIYRYGDEHQPVTTADILTRRGRLRWDLWSAYQTIQGEYAERGISVAVPKENVSIPGPFTALIPTLSSTAHCG